MSKINKTTTQNILKYAENKESEVMTDTELDKAVKKKKDQSIKDRVNFTKLMAASGTSNSSYVPKEIIGKLVKNRNRITYDFMINGGMVLTKTTLMKDSVDFWEGVAKNLNKALQNDTGRSTLLSLALDPLGKKRKDDRKKMNKYIRSNYLNGINFFKGGTFEAPGYKLWSKKLPLFFMQISVAAGKKGYFNNLEVNYDFDGIENICKDYNAKVRIINKSLDEMKYNDDTVNNYIAKNAAIKKAKANRAIEVSGKFISSKCLNKLFLNLRQTVLALSQKGNLAEHKVLQISNVRRCYGLILSYPNAWVLKGEKIHKDLVVIAKSIYTTDNGFEEINYHEV